MFFLVSNGRGISEIDVVWEDDELWECRRSTAFLSFKELLSWVIKKQHHLDIFSFGVVNMASMEPGLHAPA